MADRLDKLLLPGERVVVRVERSYWSPSGATFCLLFSLFMLAISPVVDFRDLPSLPQLMALLAASLVIGGILYPIGLRPAEALLTDRHVIHAAGWFKSSIVRVPLDEIGSIRYLTGVITVTNRWGREIDFPFPRVPRAFSEALAWAAGLPAPPVRSRTAVALRSVALFGALTCAVIFPFAGPAALANFGIVGELPHDEAFLLRASLLVAGSLLGLSLGTPLGYMTAMAAMKSAVTAKEMRAAIRVNAASDQPWATVGWHIRLYLRWADFLYGPEVAAAREEAGDHG